MIGFFALCYAPFFSMSHHQDVDDLLKGMLVGEEFRPSSCRHGYSYVTISKAFGNFALYVSRSPFIPPPRPPAPPRVVVV